MDTKGKCLPHPNNKARAEIAAIHHFIGPFTNKRPRTNKKIEIAKNEYCEPTVYIELEKPVLIFAINTSDRAKETLINLMMLKENNMKYRTIAVIDEDAQITEKDKSRLINRASRPIIGLSDFRETIDEYLVG